MIWITSKFPQPIKLSDLLSAIGQISVRSVPLEKNLYKPTKINYTREMHIQDLQDEVLRLRKEIEWMKKMN
tara:strand:+ start:4454 stop:4666 length:213 start_codon:yes stop_codon:yes gene_type:complete